MREVKYDSELHRKIIRELTARVQYAQSKLNERFNTWREADEQSVAYISEREKDRINKAQKKTGVLDYVQVEVPYSYGMLMTAHTYWASVFLGRSPVYSYEGRHGESMMNQQAIESLIHYQYGVGKMSANHYIWLYDCGKYGVGIMGRYWDTQYARYSEYVEEPELYLGQETGRTIKKRRLSKVKGYEGNSLYNIQPYNFLFDPSVTYAQLDDGEFAGHIAQSTWMKLKQDKDRYFNLDILEKQKGAATKEEHGSDRVSHPLRPGEDHGLSSELSKGGVKLVHLCIRIIPKEWKLGNTDEPEIWCFTMADDKVLIECRPLGEITDRFPYYTIESEIEGYQLFRRGILEAAQPLNDVMTWLINSHFHNVRAALNNQFVYDPSKIHAADILDPQPGKRIRLKPSAYDTDVRSAVTQLQSYDVTQTHMNDMNGVGELLQRALGINDNVMGMLDPGGRKTATEVQQAGSNSVHRLKTTAEYMSATGFSVLATDLLKSTQQFYQGDKQFRIVGAPDPNNPYVQVTPETIAGMYDYIPIDGVLPQNKAAALQTMQTAIQTMSSSEVFMQQYDVMGMLIWLLKESGLKNIQNFRIQMQPQPTPGSTPIGGGNAPVIE